MATNAGTGKPRSSTGRRAILSGIATWAMLGCKLATVMAHDPSLLPSPIVTIVASADAQSALTLTTSDNTGLLSIVMPLWTEWRTWNALQIDRMCNPLYVSWIDAHRIAAQMIRL